MNRVMNCHVFLFNMLFGAVAFSSVGLSDDLTLPLDPSERRALTGEPNPADDLIQFGYEVHAGPILTYPQLVSINLGFKVSPFCGPLLCLGPSFDFETGAFGKKTMIGLGGFGKKNSVSMSYSKFFALSDLQQMANIDSNMDGLELQLVLNGVVLQFGQYEQHPSRQGLTSFGIGYVFGYNRGTISRTPRWLKYF